MFHKKIDLQYYDNDIISNHPDVQQLLVKKDFEKNWNAQLFDLKSVLPEFYNWCEDLFNSKITVTRFFISLPKTSTKIHVDYGYNIALNIPIINCNDQSKNIWYNVDPNKKPLEPNWQHDASTVNFAANNGAAIGYPPDSIIGPIHEVVLDKPTLFNTSIPHNVVTEEEVHRIVLTVRTESMRRSSNISFDDFIKGH